MRAGASVCLWSWANSALMTQLISSLASDAWRQHCHWHSAVRRPSASCMLPAPPSTEQMSRQAAGRARTRRETLEDTVVDDLCTEVKNRALRDGQRCVDHRHGLDLCTPPQAMSPQLLSTQMIWHYLKTNMRQYRMIWCTMYCHNCRR